MIWRCLYAHMVGNAEIAAAATIYPSWLPQQNTTFPAITFSVDDVQDDQLLDGVGSLTQSLVSIDCWAATYAAAHTLADVVKAELVGYVGTFGNVTASPQVAVTVNHIRKTRELDLFESDTGLYRVSLQFLIAHGD